MASIRTRALRALAAAIAATVLASASASPPAPAVTRLDAAPKNVLFFGNSFNYYNNSLHGHLRSLVRAADPAGEKGSVFKSATISGGFLHEHEGTVPAILKTRKWDVVILQGQSTEPIEADKTRSERFRETARRYDALVKAAGARTGFFMTWAYQDKPEMTEQLATGYLNAGNELGALVVPAGLAFERSLRARPDLILHHTDRQHPSLAGTYLAACTFYAALYGRSPVGVAYDAGLGEETAAHLQRVAWATVREFYRWP